MSSAGDANGGLPGRPTFSSTSGSDGATRGPVRQSATRPTTSRTSARPGTSATGRPGAGARTSSSATTGAAAGSRAAIKRGNPRTGWRRFVNYPRYHVTSFRRWLPSWRVVVGAFLGVFALGVGVVVAAYATTKVPTAAPYTKLQTSTVYYSDGKTVIGNLRSASAGDDAYSNQNRKIVTLADLPDYVSQAVVASEDRSFYKNSGVDPKGIARAFVTNLHKAPGANSAGGSTITQQYVERYFHEGSTTDYVGKFKEALTAVKVSKEIPKDQILEGYINTIYFGRGAYGIETAAEAYFGTTAAKLTPSQSALLAGLIPAPSAWDPAIGPKSKGIAEGRWKRNLGFMLDDEYITQDQYDKAIKDGFPKTKKVQKSKSLSGQRGYLIDMVRHELSASGMTDEQMDTKGMKIVTTIDKSMEDEAVAQVKTTAKDASKYLGTGLATVDPSNGAILAIYGGKDWVKNPYNASASGFDGIKGATAQGGSTFKAFALAAGLEAGYSLDQTFDGSDGQKIDGWDTPTGIVNNFDGEGFANETLRQGFYDSVNTIFAHLNVQIGPAKTQEMAERLGLQKIHDNPANVLGTDSVSALQMASAYGVFASGGLKTTPHVIKKATDSEGELVYQGPTKQKRVISAEVAAGVVSAMQDVPVKGTAKHLPDTYQNPVQYVGRPIAGKTGSANSNFAAWFVGFTPQVSTAVGNWQSTKSGKVATIEPFGWYKLHGWTMTGGSWPVALWSNYMKVITADMPVEQFPEYDPTLSTWTPTATQTPTQTATEEPTDQPTQDQATQVPQGLVGQNVAAARQAIRQAGLNPTVTKQYSDTVAPDVVMSVSPNEGSTVNRGTTVLVVISQGPEPKATTQVPGGLVGGSSDAAQAAVKGAGLNPAVRTEWSDQPAGTVIRVEPSEGATVDQGSTVTIVVSDGKGAGGDGGGGGGSTTPPTSSPTDGSDDGNDQTGGQGGNDG
ncbi:transglycosylase domain-containing protein [Luteimicrobium xylanilyticum]|uniref:Peptidoglycan glycosyltransferase n=1 Tax=Luteimicrobium xylanilyticum TaxID=1133546 RepID=A0A5P9Q5B6_9MICO|nr:transglycosylase domain-containing protein [Luteimicrobium xylanilyticum]QFU96543.1 Peptidoglycan glycosyltransferase [Luteimicrobium xylanilyticum]